MFLVRKCLKNKKEKKEVLKKEKKAHQKES